MENLNLNELKVKVINELNYLKEKGWENNYNYDLLKDLSNDDYWNRLFEVIGGDRKEYSDYLKEYYKDDVEDTYGIFVNKDKNKIDEYWLYVNENIGKYINKDKINIFELHKGLDIMYWGYVEIIENGGDDVGCNGEGISMIWDEISEMIGFEYDEFDNGLRHIMHELEIIMNK